VRLTQKTFVFLIIFVFSNLLAKEHLFVVSGVITNGGSDDKIEKFVDMIEKNTGYALRTMYVNSYERLSHVLRDNPDALGWTCGAPYVEDSEHDGQQLIAVPLLNNLPTYSSFIITRKDNNKKALVDFKDKIFAYSDLRSNSGYVAPSVILKDHGYDIGNFFRVKILAGNHERSIESVYRGLADVAAIDEYVWLEAIKANPKYSERLHVIEKSGPFPFTPVVAGADVEKKTIKRVQDFLTKMKENEFEEFKKDFHMDGFVIKEPSFFEPIKKMLESLKER